MTARLHPRRVIVDDTDPQIQYSSSDHWILNADPREWPFASGNPDPSGGSGQPFRSTTHLAVSASSSLSFHFRGSSPQAFGTNTGTLIGCFINGTGIPPVFEGRVTTNHHLQCDWTDLAREDGEYTVTLNASAVHPAPGALFWFDYITYIPSPSAPRGSATLLINNIDPAVVHTSGWEFSDSSTRTQTNNSQFTFNFIGTSVTCVGHVPSQDVMFPGIQPPLDPTLVYTIDSGPGVLVGIHRPSPRIWQSHYIYFDIPQLSPGPHSLVVVILSNHTYGTRNRSPITFNYFIVDNAPPSSTTFPPSLPPIASPPPPPAIPSTTAAIPTNMPSTPPPIGAIVGGIIGGIIALCLIAFLLWRCKRQQTIGHLNLGLDDPIELRPITPFPATSPGPLANGHIRKGYHLNISSGVPDPHPIAHARPSNLRKAASSRAPLVEIAHEDSDTRGDRLDGPSVIPDPYLIRHAQSPNQRKEVPSRAPLVETAHEDNDVRDAAGSVGPPPSYALDATSSGTSAGGRIRKGYRLDDPLVIPDPYPILHANNSNPRKGIPSRALLIETAHEENDTRDATGSIGLPPSYASK